MKTNQSNPLLAQLRHHVTGAIERGEAVAIVEQPAPHVTTPTHPHAPNTGHTPGPWIYAENGLARSARGETQITFGPSFHCLGVLFNRNADHPTAAEFANARLIASAPALLAALEALYDREVQEKTDYDPLWIAARSAISQAKGAA